MKSKVTFAAKELYLRNYDNGIVKKVWEKLRVEYKKIIELREHINKYYQNYIVVKY